MAKKQSKGKEKKLLRKEENNKTIQEKFFISDALRRANGIDDLLKDYPAFQQYTRNGLELELQFQKAEMLPENVLDWAFNLCKSNMEEFYNASWGWKDDTKQDELAAPEARFLLAYTKGTTEERLPVAFVHMRWEKDDTEGWPVLYCYDIQLEPWVQRKALGRHLMKFLELVARRTEMHEVMLTVQLQNEDALRMYRNLGYEDHWDQPEAPEGEDSASYVILTKKLPASAAQQQRALKPVTNSHQLENIIYG